MKSTNAEVRQRCKSILLKISDLERRRALDALGVRGVKRVTTYLSNIENEEETRNNLNDLNDLKGAYFKSFIEDVSTFSDEEIYFIIPELIKLLKNDNLLPGGPKGSSNDDDDE